MRASLREFYRLAAETENVIALVSDYNLGAEKPRDSRRRA